MVEKLLLSDGRVLGFEAFGPAWGPPVFYCHGWPASRLEAALAGDIPGRLIALDRPGYGWSSPHPGRTLRDWAADLAALADHLGIGRFHLVGVSGGAPYALACAQAMPARVAGVALISPLPPLASASVPGEGLRRLRWFGLHPRSGRAIMILIRQAIRTGVINPHRVLEKAAAPRDASCLTPSRRAALVAAWQEGLRQGVQGALSDARIYATAAPPSGSLPRLSIWHGDADRVVPVSSLSAYADLQAEIHVLPGEGHYSVALDHATNILVDLVG